MISSTLKVIGCLFVFCLIVFAQNPAQKTRTSTISGRVTLKGNGIAGILVGVRVSSVGRGVATSMAPTDEQGNYRLSNVPPGQYEVALAAPQYLLAGAARTKKLIVGEGENIENVDFSLIRGGVITGKVTDRDGRPLVEESVEVFGPEGPNTAQTSRMSLSSNSTDDRGVYRIYGLAPGKYRVAAGTSEDRLYYGRGPHTVYSQTFYPSTTESAKATLIEVTEGGEATNVDITLHRTMGVFTVTARIVDADTGQPIPDATYGLEKFRENGGSSTSGRPANKLGEIKIESLTPGKYALSVVPTALRDVYSEPVRFEVVDQDIKLVIKASSGGAVAGTVVFEGIDERVAPKLDSLMILAHVVPPDMKYRSGGGSSPNVALSAGGNFSLRGLRAGTVFFSIWGQNKGPMNQFDVARIERDGVVQPTLEIKAREQINGLRLIVRSRSGRIRGIVKLENGQIPFTRVFISARKIGDENFETALQVDDRGRFQSEALTAGVYELRLLAYVARARPVQTTQQVVVSDNQVSDVTFTLDVKAETGPDRP